MEKIPETFRKYGYDFKLLIRIGDVALYSQSRNDCQGNKTTYAFEVHKVRVKKEHLIYGTICQDREILAHKNEFGYYGWSFGTYKDAIYKFRELVKEVEDGSTKHEQ